VNHETPDPECDLNYLGNGTGDAGLSGAPEFAMSNSFGFGGVNAVGVLRRS
jgi:3-oxoacyl-[acyl-carrier-protein] synthase II